MRLSIGMMGFLPIDATLPVVQAAEQLGLDGVWAAEHVGFHDAIVPSTVYLQQTQRLEIGLVGLSVAGRHPALTAMELMSLCELAPGRVRVQVGTGDPSLMAKIGHGTPANALANVTAMVETLRSLLAGQVVQHSSALFTVDGLQLMPSAPPPAIDVMAIRPRMIELAARIGDGVSLGFGTSRTYLAETVVEIERHLERLGRDRSAFRITATVFVSLAPTIDAARAQLAPFLMMFPLDTFAVLARGATMPTPAAVAAAAASGDPQAAVQAFSPETIDAIALISTPESVGAALDSYAQLGIDELVLVFPPATPPDAQIEAIKLFTTAHNLTHAHEQTPAR